MLPPRSCCPLLAAALSWPCPLCHSCGSSRSCSCSVVSPKFRPLLFFLFIFLTHFAGGGAGGCRQPPCSPRFLSLSQISDLRWRPLCHLQVLFRAHRLLRRSDGDLGGRERGNVLQGEGQAPSLKHGSGECPLSGGTDALGGCWSPASRPRRSGSAGASSRSSPAPLWATSSAPRAPTPSPRARR